MRSTYAREAVGTHRQRSTIGSPALYAASTNRWLFLYFLDRYSRWRTEASTLSVMSVRSLTPSAFAVAGISWPSPTSPLRPTASGSYLLSSQRSAQTSCSSIPEYLVQATSTAWLTLMNSSSDGHCWEPCRD